MYSEKKVVCIIATSWGVIQGHDVGKSFLAKQAVVRRCFRSIVLVLQSRVLLICKN